MDARVDMRRFVDRYGAASAAADAAALRLF